MIYPKVILKMFDIPKEVIHVVFFHVKTKVFAHIFKRTTHFLVHIIQFYKLASSIGFETMAFVKEKEMLKKKYSTGIFLSL